MKQPTDIDMIIAQNLRIIRKNRKETLKDIATQICVSYQQLWKYESCENRINAGKLWDLSKIYGVNIERFFVSDLCDASIK